MEDGLGAAHREENFPLGCDGSARESAGVSAEMPVLDEAVAVRLW